VKRFVGEYSSINEGKGLHVLLVTSGGLNTGPRRDTKEGVEHNFAISYLGRFLVINKLIPLLARSGEGRVMSVLSAGRAGPIDDLDDIEMKKPGAYGKMKSAAVNSMATDFMMEELTMRNPSMAFYHIDPGMVATNILVNNQIPLGSVTQSLMSCIAKKPEDYAEALVHIATSPDFGPSKSGSGLNEKAQVVAKHPFQSTPGARERVWQYSVQTSGLDSE